MMRAWIVATAIGAAALTIGWTGRPQAQPRPATVAPTALAKPETAPNIILIVADDLGYGDTGVYGSTLIKTPNIDALAHSGVRFTAGYVTHPVCSPSRAALMTGRYQQRFGYEFNPVGRDATGGVALNEVMIGQIMQRSGYRTGMIGKWHIGQGKGGYPTDRGFDEYFGMASGGSTYIVDPQPGDGFFTTPETEQTVRIGRYTAAPAQGPDAQRRRLARARVQFPITRNGTVVDVPGYLTDAFTDEATGFIDRNASKPFFLYVAYTAPHTPLQATKRYVDRYAHVTDPGKRVYAAMVSALDDGVGRIVERLRERGLDRRTLVVFLSDNGCAGYLNGACSNAPLGGFKGSHLEGGVRVPFIMAMPGRLPAGRIDTRAVSTLDVLPTAAALAKATLPTDRRLDGVNLLPYLTGARQSSPDRALFWRAGDNVAIRDGDRKMWTALRAPLSAKPGYLDHEDLAATTSARNGSHVMLYDLKRDPGEQRNLAAARPAEVRALSQKITVWNKGLIAPQWPSRRVAYVAHDGVTLEVHD